MNLCQPNTSSSSKGAKSRYLRGHFSEKNTIYCINSSLQINILWYNSNWVNRIVCFLFYLLSDRPAPWRVVTGTFLLPFLPGETNLGGNMPQIVSAYYQGGGSHSPCGTRSAVRFCSLTEDWYADTVLVRLQQCGPKGFRRYGNGQTGQRTA